MNETRGTKNSLEGQKDVTEERTLETNLLKPSDTYVEFIIYRKSDI